MVKFLSLAQFQGDLFHDPLIPSFVFLFFSQFASFDYYLINCLMSVSTLTTLAIILRIMSFRFHIIGSYAVVLYFY